MQVVLVKTDSDTEHYEMSKSPTILKVSYVVIVYDLDHQVISRVITFNSDEKVKKLLASASKQ